MYGFEIALFGRRLRGLRRERGMTQQVFAAQLGAPQGWLSEVETGKQAHVQADTVVRFARALECSTDYLLGLTDTPTLRHAPTPPRLDANPTAPSTTSSLSALLGRRGGGRDGRD